MSSLLERSVEKQRWFSLCDFPSVAIIVVACCIYNACEHSTTNENVTNMELDRSTSRAPEIQ